MSGSLARVRSAEGENRAILGLMDRAASDPADEEIHDRGPAWRRAAVDAVRHLDDAALPGAVRSALQLLDRAVADDVAVPTAHAAPAVGAHGDLDTWPRLSEFAQVHGTVFRPGASSRAVVDEAIRYYQFEQQPPRVASRASVLERFGEQVGAIISPGTKND